jgi:hypothetical protein
MNERRIHAGRVAVIGLVSALAAVTRAPAADPVPKLADEVARAERILIGIPERKGVARGEPLDVPAGERFLVEIDRPLRGTGRKTAQALIVNGGDEKRHPTFIAGKPYVFLLKRDPEGKRWVNLSVSEIPIKDGKVQFLVGGKVVEQLAVDDFEELASKDSPAIVEKVPTRDALTGKWTVVLNHDGSDAHLWLVELKKESGERTGVRLMSSSPRLQASALKSSSIEGDAVRLIFDADGAVFDFQGRFENGTVRGNYLMGPHAPMPARMVPTDAGNLPEHENAVPDPALEEFFEARDAKEPIAPLSKFVRRYPQSPLAISAYLKLIDHACAAGFDRGKFDKLGSEYLQAARRWGPRMELRAFVDMGVALSQHESLPELALEYLNAADKAFDDGTPVHWKQVVGIARGKRLIAAGQAAEGTALLTGIREEYPFEPVVIYALARQAEKEKRTDDALALYGEIIALPGMEHAVLESLKVSGRKPPFDEYPSRIVSRLWAEKHGNREGLPDWIMGVYDSRIRSIAGEKRPPRQKNEGTRVVVCELFTNGDCEPSVGADVALAALESEYARSEVVVLRYHQQKPAPDPQKQGADPPKLGPDPLANEDAIERFKQYLGTTTPALFVNGRRSYAGGGSLSDAPAMYRRLHAYVETILEEKVDLRLELAAKIDQGKVSISARAAGLNEFPANARLMLVLAEERIVYLTKNGIRKHEMIVRALPASLAGVSAVKGRLEYSGEVDLAKLKKRLAQHLAVTERENGIPFDDKPLDLKSLQLVVLLQNSETGEVLQAAAVPVIGAAPSAPETKSAGSPEPVKKPASGGN